MREDCTYRFGLSYKRSFSNVAVRVWLKMCGHRRVEGFCGKHGLYEVPRPGARTWAWLGPCAPPMMNTICLRAILSTKSCQDRPQVASLRSREMELEVREGKALIVNFNPAPGAPREFRGQQRADCLFQRYAKSCCDRGSHHHDSIGAWGLRSEVSIVPVPAAVEPIFR